MLEASSPASGRETRDTLPRRGGLPDVQQLLEFMPQVIVVVGDALRAVENHKVDHLEPDSAPWNATANCWN
jgi:hypothetical protein